MFGSHLKLDVRGASHAKKMTFSLENFPAGLKVDEKKIAEFMERRAPGRDKLSTARREADEIVWRGGFAVDGTTTGETIVGEIASHDMRPGDYGVERTIPRPGHADFGQWIQFGRIPTGGGKNSGRLTAPLCAAGALCLQWLESRGIYVDAAVESVRGKTAAHEMISEIECAKKKGDSVGGTIVCEVKGLPPGIGGALEDGVESSLSSALFAIPGVRGVEFGTGFEDARTRFGSEANDTFAVKNGAVVTKTNRQGGIMGGRTNGSAVVFHLAIRPTPTVYVEQDSVDLATMTPARLSMKGRHDPCIVRRAVPVVEAVTAFAVLDAILADEAARPRICLTLTGKTLAEDLAQYESQRYFTDMVELRVDLLTKSERAKVATFPAMMAKSSPWKVPVVLTFRRKCDGGAFTGSEAERVRFFEKILAQRRRGAEICFDYVDFEEGFGGEKLLKLAHGAGAKVVRSLHKFDGPVKNIVSKLRTLGEDGDIAKIAFMPRSLADVSKLFTSIPRSPFPPLGHPLCGLASLGGYVPRSPFPIPRSPFPPLLGHPLRGLASLGGYVPRSPFPVPRLIIAMGASGLATRVLAGRLGSPWTYASVGGLGNLGHVTPRDLVRDYRFRSVSKNAALYGVTGWPLLKTRSPELHNAAFLVEDEDAVMIPFPSKTAREALGFMKAMGMKGMAVTIPHKQEIMPLLDRIDPAARKIGAVNTVALENGKYVGYNTDVSGFAEALVAFAGDVKGRRVAVLGDGGAAQAVKAALKNLGAKFSVFHRATPPQGFEILVNATPVDPIPDYVFTGREAVYDLRYVPETTPLMARAAAAGCRVENGFSMLIAQARGQRRIWGV